MEITYKQEILRKLIHLSSLWMLLPMWFFPRALTVVLFGLLLAGNILVEYGTYQKWRWCGPIYHALFGKMMREKERKKGFHLSGAPYVLASAFMVSILFPMHIAMIGFTTMLLADVVAALVGRKFGRHKFNGPKSLEGSAAFWITGWVVLVFYGALFHMHWLMFAFGLIGLTVATLAEGFEKQLHLDDNFSIPLVIGLFLCLGL